MIDAVMSGYRRVLANLACKWFRVKRREDGQGTTEYAILVGVLVVIAIIAITVFRPKLQELGLGALWRGVSGGLFIEHALSTASHHIEGAAPQTLADILLY